MKEPNRAIVARQKIIQNTSSPMHKTITLD